MNKVQEVTAQELVRRLIEVSKMTPIEVSEALEGRVSGRTIYRWAKGESVPGNSSDLLVLFDLAKMRGVVSSNATPVLGTVKAASEQVEEVEEVPAELSEVPVEVPVES